MSESFRNSIFMGAHREHWGCAGGSEMRSAAPAIQGGGQADQKRPASRLDCMASRVFRHAQSFSGSVLGSWLFVRINALFDLGNAFAVLNYRAGEFVGKQPYSKAYN